MKLTKKHHTEAEKLQILRKLETFPETKTEFARRHGINRKTLRRWEIKFSGKLSAQKSNPQDGSKNKMSLSDKKVDIKNLWDIQTETPSKSNTSSIQTKNASRDWNEVNIDFRPVAKSASKTTCPICGSEIPPNTLAEHQQKIQIRNQSTPISIDRMEIMLLQHAVEKPTLASSPCQRVGKLPPTIF